MKIETPGERRDSLFQLAVNRLLFKPQFAVLIVVDIVSTYGVWWSSSRLDGTWLKLLRLAFATGTASTAVIALVVYSRGYVRGFYSGIEQNRPPSPDAPPAMTFPRFWSLFPLILPRHVRERVYAPCAEELKEDYLRERRRRRGKWEKRYVTFCFTVRTLGLVGNSLWAATGGASRKALAAAAAIIIGGRAVAVLREWYAGVFGRLP